MARRTIPDHTVTPVPAVWRTSLADHITRLRFSPDGAMLAAASLSGEAVVLDATSGEPVHKLGEHRFGSLDIAWSPDGSRLASAGHDGRVAVWDAATGELLGEAGAKGWASRVAWSPDGARLAAAIGKDALLLSADGAEIGRFGQHSSTVSDVVWTIDGCRVGVVGYGGVRWFGSGTPKAAPDKVFAWKGAPLRAAMSPKGNYLVHGNQDNSIHVWKMANGAELEMQGYPAKIDVLAWDRTGEWLANGTVGGTTVWDCSGKGPAGRAAIMCDGHDRRVTAVVWERRGNAMVSGSADGTVQWYRPRAAKGAKAGRPLGGYLVGGEVTDLDLRSDDAVLAVALSSGTICIAPIVVPW